MSYNLADLEHLRHLHDLYRPSICSYAYVKHTHIYFDHLLTFISGILGLSRQDEALIEQSFDVLSLEALFMVPRVCSILSLSPYWGTLIPCLKEMGKDFIK